MNWLTTHVLTPRWRGGGISSLQVLDCDHVGSGQRKLAVTLLSGRASHDGRLVDSQFRRDGFGHQYPWHPRLSQKLGLCRLIQVPGSHELCFSNPSRLAQAIMDAGRD